MENETFRSRLFALMQKSRKAIRLYTTMGTMPEESSSEYRELQVDEWKQINAELLKQLTSVLDSPASRHLAAEVFSIRDYFYGRWRMAESEMHVKQKELIFAAEHGDFVKASLLGRELVALKARTQAAQAAHHELDDVVQRSRISMPPLELSQDRVVPEVAIPQKAKVIPLRKQV